MSWDIVIFSSRQKIVFVEDINEELFVPIDFSSILEKHFDNIIQDEEHREISGNDFSINYYIDKEPVSNKLFSLYGEKALFELINISRIYNWQIFDTGNGEMLDLNHPEKNGYENFQSYLQHVLKNSD
jgi:hypothetical protein